jgi:hypothetical protein
MILHNFKYINEKSYPLIESTFLLTLGFLQITQIISLLLILDRNVRFDARPIVFAGHFRSIYPTHDGPVPFECLRLMEESITFEFVGFGFDIDFG